MKRFTWSRLVVTLAAALATYYLRSGFALIGLGTLTFLLPTLFAAYFFGSLMAIVALVVTLLVLHGILWTESPQLLFTRQYGGVCSTTGSSRC